MVIKKIKPVFTALITTMDKYEHDIITDGGLIDTSKQQGCLKEYQRVVAVGTTVRDIKEGDLKVAKNYNLPIVLIDTKKYNFKDGAPSVEEKDKYIM